MNVMVPAGGAPEQFGPYRVYESLGEGGMATVHRAVQQTPSGGERTVALKRLLPEFAHNEDFVASFVREARIASQLRHVNCAQTFDLGQVGDTYFIAMELVAGSDIRRILRQTATITGPMPVALAINIIGQICDALEYAHNLRDDKGQPMGIIHRDVSPANVLVASNGTAKLIDFGIAKASAANLATMSGQLKGKFAYMAPENLTGSIDARADLFAVGVIAHELLTARPLFAGGEDDFETLRRVRSMPIVPPSQINRESPVDLDTIVLTALARDPEERWQSAAAMRGALRNVAQSTKLTARNPDVANWMSWAFAQTARVPSKAAGKARAPQDTDSPSISVDPEPGMGSGGGGGESRTIDDSMLSAATETTQLPGPSTGKDTGNDAIMSVTGGGADDDDPSMAPARTIMFGGGVPMPNAAGTPRPGGMAGGPSATSPSSRISAAIAAQTAPGARISEAHPVRTSSSMAAVSPATPMMRAPSTNPTPGSKSAPIAAAAAPTTSPPVAPRPVAPATEMLAAELGPAEVRGGMSIVVILIICAVAAGLGFLIVTLVQ